MTPDLADSHCAVDSRTRSESAFVRVRSWHEIMIHDRRRPHHPRSGRLPSYIVQPSILLWREMKKVGKPVPETFSYASNTNERWLTADALLKLVRGPTRVERGERHFPMPPGASGRRGRRHRRGERRRLTRRVPNHRTDGGAVRSRLLPSACAGAMLIACSSGTAALHLAAMAIGLGPGDAAIVPSLTFLATANAVRFVGAEVIFADVDRATGMLTADTLRAATRDQISRRQDQNRAAGPSWRDEFADAEERTRRCSSHGRPVSQSSKTRADAALGAIAAHGTVVGDCAHSALAAFSTHPVARPSPPAKAGSSRPMMRRRDERARRLRNH